MKASLSYPYKFIPVGSSLVAALQAFVIYLLTADSSVSYWDCPEYVLTASSLQIGHPPGNPIWTLAMRIATIPFATELHARVINICSSILMALAVFFLVRIIYRFICQVLTAQKSTHRFLTRNRISIWSATVAALTSLCFAVLDSTWFSAVEAEVYAFSTFLTAFTIWLMLKWAEAPSQKQKDRMLILVAYVLGLSLGVHQLNLLCLPVLALIFIYERYPNRKCLWQGWLAIALSFVIVGIILLGLMPGAVAWSAALELLCVNKLGLPYFSGIIIYAILMISVSVVAVRFIPTASRLWLSVLVQSVIWLSGIYVFKCNIWIALLISIVTAQCIVALMSRRAILTTTWMLVMIWLGYSAVILLLVRGYASPPVNEAAPTDIFSMQRYIAREQYGSKPLFYGPTPFSRPMLEERINPHSPVPDYSHYVLEKEGPRYARIQSSPRLAHRSRMLSHTDSTENNTVVHAGYGYLLTDYRFSRKTTPELNMFFPRITSSAPHMFESYTDWAGMTRDNMQSVEITTAIDSTGKAVGKLSLSGERLKERALRPTYLQNLRFFLSYQIGYMYMRYLLWNFVGRQNDIPSTGEIDHGNVITGFEPIDTMMLGNQSLMPTSATYENAGRHTYYAIPFILGIVGIIFLLRSGRGGKRIASVVTMLFLMTGLAIVVYLNQTPGEPRERDYAFIGSYMAFCIWIAFGLIYLGMLAKRFIKSNRVATGIVTTSGALLFILLIVENYPDHNRAGRYHTRAFALNTLAGKDRDIIFSYGDNYSFPLWYAQEVEGAAPKATIIDVSYLSTPEYVVNLLKQGDKGLKLTATPGDIAFGAYAFTRVASDADTVPRPLLEILRKLYASGDANPTLHNSRALLPGRTMADTITLNLRSLATTSGMIPFRTLMLLDIIATNLDQPSPRPLSFLSSVKREVIYPVKDATLPEAFSDTYAPFMTTEEYIDRLIASVKAVDSTSNVHHGKQPYIDPVIDDQVRHQRGGVVRVATQLMNVDKPQKAHEMLLRFPGLFPSTAPGSYTFADTTYLETLEAARLLLAERDSTAALAALDLLNRSREEAEGWHRYYFSLPKWRRHAVSNSSRRLITTLPLIDSLTYKAKAIL
ncbi:MAG: DUF2723 domain-containing protein, partial [Muribaculaceae bacterium]|nr:DUF2723 domain-containing protein [Muribaculaceae bacterium]